MSSRSPSVERFRHLPSSHRQEYLEPETIPAFLKCLLGQDQLQPGIEPPIPVERFGTVEQALKIGNHYDLLILDGLSIQQRAP